MNRSIPTPAKTDTVNLDTLNAAQRITPAQTRRTPAGNWDLLAVIGLMACSAAYSICAIMQGF